MCSKKHIKQVKHRKEISKIILFLGQGFLDGLILLTYYGWLHNAGDISQPLTSLLVTKAVLYAAYYIKAGMENKSKGNLEITKVSNDKISDFITILTGILSGMTNGNTADALNSILQAVQSVMDKHTVYGSTTNDFQNSITNNVSNDVQSDSDVTADNIQPVPSDHSEK